MAPRKKQDFEAGLKELEALAEQMEGDMSLEDSLAAYEKGMKLHAQLSAQLDAGEKKLRLISEEKEETDEL